MEIFNEMQCDADIAAVKIFVKSNTWRPALKNQLRKPNDMLAKNATSNVSFCPVPCPLPSYPPLRAVLLTTDIFSNVGIDMTTTTIACV